MPIKSLATQLHQQFITGLREAKGVTDPASLDMHRKELVELWIKAYKLLAAHQDQLDTLSLSQLHHITDRTVGDHLVMLRGQVHIASY